MKATGSAYTPLTPRMALNLAAPHTWPAAVMPTLVAVCAAGVGFPISVHMALVLLAGVVLMQSAANTFNDYYDYVKGTDSAQDNFDPDDSVLVYNNVNPRHALVLAVSFLVVALLLGTYVVYRAGVAPLVIAAIGAVFVVIYSAGKTPLSYLPLGELSSGLVMGGLITLASYQALTLHFDLIALLWALPTIIGVALIMLTNNMCDIERDIPAGRHTLPIVLGRDKARRLYHALVYVWVVAIVAIVAIWFTSGLVVVPFMLLAAYPIVKALMANPLTPERRLQAMPQVLTVNVVLGAFYCSCILASGMALSL